MIIMLLYLLRVVLRMDVFLFSGRHAQQTCGLQCEELFPLPHHQVAKSGANSPRLVTPPPFNYTKMYTKKHKNI